MQPVEGQLEQGFVIGGYRIDELIGRGGMGVVYRATNVALNRIYAVKVLPPELAADEQYRERFRREMRLAASIHHPNVVGVHHAGEEDGRLFFAMDFVYGTDLRQLLRIGGALDPARAVDLLTQVTSALDAAHRRGLVHRDVKPANILITVTEGEERAYLTDFGVAKRSDAASQLTAKGVAVGTVDYMAPEQINGGQIDARADVYALGCVFFQMLTGRVPYERENSIAKLYAHVHEPPPPLEGALADLYPAFGPVIETAMAKLPDDRYLSAGDFGRDASAALRGLRYSGPASSVGTGEATPVRHHELHDQPAPEPVRHAPADASTVAASEYPDAPAPAVPISSAALEAPPRDAAPAPPADAGPWLRRHRWGIGAGAVLLVAAIAAVVLLTTGGSSSAPSGQPFAAGLRPVPTNQVTGTGLAVVRLQGDTISATVDTNGLLQGSAHAMHIHAGAQGICPTAAAARLHNGHLAISTGDGLKFYGPPQASLTTSGDTSTASITAFQRFPATGTIRYRRTFTIPSALANEIRSGNAVVVVHGIDYNHNGIYDDVIGTSDLYKALPGEATAPALCGSLFSTQATAEAVPGGGSVYVATLQPYDPGPADTPSLWLFCHLPGSAGSLA